MLKIKKYSSHRKNSRSPEMRVTGVVWGAGARLVIAALLLMLMAGAVSADWSWCGSGCNDTWTGNSSFDNITVNGTSDFLKIENNLIKNWGIEKDGAPDVYPPMLWTNYSIDAGQYAKTSNTDKYLGVYSAYIYSSETSDGTAGMSQCIQIPSASGNRSLNSTKSYKTYALNGSAASEVVTWYSSTNCGAGYIGNSPTYLSSATWTTSIRDITIPSNAQSIAYEISAYTSYGANYLHWLYADEIYVRLDGYYPISNGNITMSSDAGAGNKVYQIDVNATGNYTVYYNDNDTGMPNILLGNFTVADVATWNNQSITISPNIEYQDTIVNVTLFGNGTATSKSYKITFRTQSTSCTVSGTSINLTEDTTISSATTWTGCNYTTTGRINISSGGTLTLDNTQLYFNRSSQVNDIYINGGNLTTDNGSLISALTGKWWYLRAGESSTSKMQLNNTTLNRGNIYLRQVTTSGGQNWLDNVTVTDWNPDVGAFGVKGLISVDEFSCLDIVNSSFTDVNYSNQDYVIYELSTGNCNPQQRIINNTFRDGAQVIVISDDTNNIGLNISSNKIYNFSQTYVIDFYNGGNGSILLDNYLEQVAGAFVYNGGNYNITLENNLVNNTASVFGSNCLSFLGVNNISVTNHTCINTGYGINPSIMTKGSDKNIVIKDSSITSGQASQSAMSSYMNDSSIYNNTFTETSATGYGINTHDSDPIKAVTSNVTFTNNTINSSGIGIKVTAATNYKFIDNNITSSSTNIKMDTNTSNIKFINNKYNNNTTSFTDSTSEFNNYYYADILVQDSSGNPIDGATITTSNLASDYPSIARNGTNLTSFTTDASGNTPLPIGNDSTTIVLMNMSKNSTVQTNMSYVLNVNESSYIYPNINTSINSTGYYSPNEPVTSTTVAPNSSWYRSVPNTYQNTTTITLPKPTNWSILPDNTISINASSDKNLTATWSGSATVLFNTTIIEWSSQVLYLNHDGVLVDTKSSNATGFVNFTYTGTNGEFNVSIDAGESNFIPPPPTSLANTTGNFWVNYTWQAGAGNVTDSFNVSHNGTWTNGSAVNFSNNSVGASNWSNITVFAWNSSGTGTLSTGSVSQNTQAPSATSGTSGPENINSTVNRYTVYWQWLNPTEASYNTTRIYINGEFIANQTATNYLLQNLQPQTTHTLSLRSVNTSGENTTWVNSTATTLTPDTGGGSGGGGGGGAYIYTPKETNETNISNPIVAQTEIIAKQQPQVQLSDVSKRQLLFGSAIALLLSSIFIFIKPRR